MSVNATIMFAPLHTLERHNDSRWNRPGRSLYEAGALKFAPGVDEVPLLVDHDPARRVGTVSKVWRGEWVDGPWLFASAVVDEPPSWLKRYETKASFGFSPFAQRSFSEGELISGALVSEVSVLSPGVEPAEPLAQVVLLERSADRAKRDLAWPGCRVIEHADGSATIIHASERLGVRS